MHIFAASYLLPINGSPVEGGAVAVENGRINAVGRLKDLRKHFTAPVHEFPGAVLLPGLVNAHTHLELTHFPSWLHSHGFNKAYCSYVEWIMQVIAVKRQVGFEALEASLLEGMGLSLQNGTTMVGDILSEHRLLPLYETSQLSGRIYLECIGQDRARSAPVLESLDGDTDSPQRRFLPGIAPHAPFTVSRSLLKTLLHAARARSIPITMHLSESAEELQFFNDSTGRLAEDLYPFVGWDEYIPAPLGTTATEWLDSAGALAPDFLAVHGVHLSTADIEKLKYRGVSVVLAPRSNHNLEVGKAPADELLKTGVPLALGTDSLASNDSLSLWDEMRFLLDAYPQVFSPEEALRMATIGGAQALKRSSEAGTLESGKRADFILMETVNMPDPGKIFAQLLEGSKLCGVWCGGKEYAAPKASSPAR